MVEPVVRELPRLEQAALPLQDSESEDVSVPVPIKTIFTVHQYSMLLNAGVEAGVVLEDFNSASKKLGAFVTTERSTPLQPASLRSKKYAADVNPGKELIGKLLDVVRVLQGMIK